MIKTVFIRYNDVLWKEVMGFRIGALIAYPERPKEKYDLCLIDIGFRGAKEDISVLHALKYYMDVTQNCSTAFLITPDNNQYYSKYSLKLADLIKYLRNKALREKFSNDVTWVLPIHGTSHFALYNTVCYDIVDFGFKCIYGLPSHRATIGMYDAFKFIDCSKEPQACINVNYFKIMKILDANKNAEFHVMGCNRAIFSTFVKSKAFERVISVDTESYRKKWPNESPDGRRMCDSTECPQWFLEWLEKAIDGPILDVSPLLFF